MQADEIKEELVSISKKQRVLEEQQELLIENYLIKAVGEALKETGHKSISWVQWAPHFNDGDICYLKTDEDSWTLDEDEELDPWTIKGLEVVIECLAINCSYFEKKYDSNYKFNIGTDGTLSMEYYVPPY